MPVSLNGRATVLKTVVREGVWVRVLPPAPAWEELTRELGVATRRVLADSYVLSAVDEPRVDARTVNAGESSRTWVVTMANTCKSKVKRKSVERPILRTGDL